MGGGDALTAPHFANAGDDSPPLPGDYAVLVDASGAGAMNAVGYADVRNVGEAEPGEKRIYARDADGAPAVSLWLKGDGTLVITNGSGTFEMAEDGVVTINGLV